MASLQKLNLREKNVNMASQFEENPNRFKEFR